MTVRTLLPILVAAGLLAGPAVAQTQVYRLSPAEIEAAKDKASERPETSALLPPRITEMNGPSLYGSDAPAKKPDIHGEVGMFVGSGGARGIYGTAGMPVGETGFAQFSFSNSQFSDRRRGYGYGGGYGYTPGYGYGYGPYAGSSFGFAYSGGIGQ